MLPWQLERGLYLEDTSLLLPWGTEIESLRSVGGAAVLDRGSSLHITWQNHVSFGGLRGTVKACWIRGEPNPRAFHIHLPELHWVAFELDERYAEPIDAHRQLRRIHDHLVGQLGPASFCYPEYSHRLPSIFWDRPPVLLSAGPQYGRTSLSLDITHTPPGYTALKAEAARLRRTEGEGARVDYVAWHHPFDE